MTSVSDVLDARSIPITECGCQVWLGATTPAGYGAMRVNGRVEYTHRLAWTMANGRIPDGLFVCHRCDVRSCINPDHLFLGTDLDNIEDMISKGRHKPPAVRWQLTPQRAEAIANAKGSNRAIAREFGVSHSTVADIKRRVSPHSRVAER